MTIAKVVRYKVICDECGNGCGREESRTTAEFQATQHRQFTAVGELHFCSACSQKPSIDRFISNHLRKGQQ